MLKILCSGCFLLLFFFETSHAQGPLKKKLESARGSGGVKIGRNSGDDSGSRRNDFEGSVWEFKIIDTKERDNSKKTHMTGRLRVKQTAVFAVGEPVISESSPQRSPSEEADALLQKFDRNSDGQLSSKELTSMVKSVRRGDTAFSASTSSQANSRGTPDVKGDMKSLVSQRLRGAKEADAGGGSRIGDFSKQNTSKSIFTFDEDDDFPLSGRAEVKPDTKKKGGVWFGHYDEYVGGKKQKRWRMELRKIDE